jgi:hypothetical protein
MIPFELCQHIKFLFHCGLIVENPSVCLGWIGLSYVTENKQGLGLEILSK